MLQVQCHLVPHHKLKEVNASKKIYFSMLNADQSSGMEIQCNPKVLHTLTAAKLELVSTIMAENNAYYTA